MPYLNSAAKYELDHGVAPTSPGDLTYLITKALLGDPREASLHEALWAVVNRYLDGLSGTPRFADYCVVLGAFDAAKREFRRRLGQHEGILWPVEEFVKEFYRTVVGPYEDTKIAENGDVYEVG